MVQRIRKSKVDKVNARLILDVLISEPKRRPVRYTGMASSVSMKSEFRDVVNRAKSNALFKYLIDRGKIMDYDGFQDYSNPVNLQVIDFRIRYFDYKFIDIKRVRRRGRYYNMVRSKKTGQIISFSRWRRTTTEELKSSNEELGLSSEEEY